MSPDRFLVGPAEARTPAESVIEEAREAAGIARDALRRRDTLIVELSAFLPSRAVGAIVGLSHVQVRNICRRDGARSMRPHDHHEHHHALIAERAAAWQAEPRRSGLDKRQRGEKAKRAAWTLKGHLRCCHGLRSLPPFASYEELEALHARHHGDARQRPPVA